jgi:5-methylthioadenosine/S-adenosylhomocysteine deaminase
METTFDLLIRGCELLQPDFSILSNAVLCVKDGRIAKIVPGAEAGALTARQEIDGAGKLAMPGLVDGHTHASQQLLRGSVIDELPMVWSRILVPFESNLTAEDSYAGALLFCLEYLKAGITTFADAGGPHMESVARAVLDTGIRACLTRSMMDQGDLAMKETTAQALQRNEELYRQFHNRGEGRLRIWFGLRQAITCSPALAEGVAARARELGTGVHIHLAEHLDEVSFCLRNYKMRPAEWYDSFGLLAPNLIAAHSVRLSDAEVKLVSERGASPVHCPRANLGNHGFSKTPLFLLLGANVGIGTDGATTGRADLFEQMRLLKSAVQARYGLEINDPLALPALETLRMATASGARAVMQAGEIGSLEVGKKADIVLLNIRQPHFRPTAHLPKTIVTNAGAGDVSDVLVDGRLLVRDRRCLLLDEEEIYRKAGEALLRVGRRAGLALGSPYTG